MKDYELKENSQLYKKIKYSKKFTYFKIKSDESERIKSRIEILDIRYEDFENNI